ncbi:MAG: hypothetical protein ACKO96_10650, partial [Flammeovirgaceae bacterium]
QEMGFTSAEDILLEKFKGGTVDEKLIRNRGSQAVAKHQALFKLQCKGCEKICLKDELICSRCKNLCCLGCF